MQSDPMKTMQTCFGQCDQVPDEVCDAVLDSLKRIPGVNGDPSQCDARAADLAARMAVEGWRFCPCFATRKTKQHARIFALVHTNLANRLAHREARALDDSAAQAKQQNAA